MFVGRYLNIGWECDRTLASVSRRVGSLYLNISALCLKSVKSHSIIGANIVRWRTKNSPHKYERGSAGERLVWGQQLLHATPGHSRLGQLQIKVVKLAALFFLILAVERIAVGCARKLRAKAKYKCRSATGLLRPYQSDKDDPFSSEMAASCGGRLTLSGLTLLLNGSLTVFVKLCPRKSYFVLINHSLGRDREGRFSQMN